eukprot:717544-Hanusia_phi.AAC.2
MERLWSSEKGREGERVKVLKPAEAKGSDEGARRSQLPLCQHCSLKHLRWPAWNHRVDHAMRVAQEIAAGSAWNETLHGGGGGEASGKEQVEKVSGKQIDEAVATLKAALGKEKVEEGRGRGGDADEAAATCRSQHEVRQPRADSVPVSRRGLAASLTSRRSVCYAEAQSLLARERTRRSAEATQKEKAMVRGTARWLDVSHLLPASMARQGMSRRRRGV